MLVPVLWEEAAPIREVCSDTVNFQQFFIADWSQPQAVKILQECPNNIRRIVRLQASVDGDVWLFTSPEDYKIVAAAGGGAYFPSGFRVPQADALFHQVQNGYLTIVSGSAIWAVSNSASIDTSISICIEGYYLETES